MDCALDEEYGGMPAAGGYKSYTYYDVPAANIAEAVHCILGSLHGIHTSSPSMKKTFPGFIMGRSHILEELRLVNKWHMEGIEFGDRSLNELEDKRYGAEAVRTIPENSERLLQLALLQKSKLESCSNISDNTRSIAKACYDVLVYLGKSMKNSIESYPHNRVNAYKDTMLAIAIRQLNKVTEAALRSEQNPVPKLKLWNDVRDCHHGQLDGSIYADDEQGNRYGRLDYAQFSSKVYIQYITVAEGFRRQGIGTALIKRLQEEFSDCHVSWTTTTESGEELRKSWIHKKLPAYEQNYEIMEYLPIPIQSSLRSEYGIKPHSLGVGGFGEAFVARRNRVVKLTTDNKESYSALKLINSNFEHPNLVKYYSIKMIPDLSSVRKYLEAEYELQRLSAGDEHIVFPDQPGRLWIIEMERARGRSLTEVERRIMYDAASGSSTVGNYNELGLKLYWSFKKQVQSLEQALRQTLGKTIDLDIHTGNVVITPDGTLKFFDIARSCEGVETKYQLFEFKNNPYYEPNEIYLRKGEIVPAKDWGGEIYYKHRTEHFVMGKPVEIDSITGPLYHATTNLPAIIQSGYLRAGGGQESGGLGGGQDKAVSFTTNWSDAVLIMRELIRMGEVVRIDATSFLSLLARYVMEDENISGVSLKRAFSETVRWFNFQLTCSPNTVVDAMNSYYEMRENDGGPKNPVMFGMASSFAKITKENAGIVVVNPRDIPTEIHEAYARYGPDDFLSEFRVYADVPLYKAKYISAEEIR